MILVSQRQTIELFSFKDNHNRNNKRKEEKLLSI